MTRIAFALAGFASAAALVVAAAIVWMCVAEPAAIANALGNGQANSILKVAAALVITALGRVVRHL